MWSTGLRHFSSTLPPVASLQVQILAAPHSPPEQSHSTLGKLKTMKPDA